MNQKFLNEDAFLKLDKEYMSSHDLAIITINEKGDILNHNSIFQQMFNIDALKLNQLNIHDIPALGKISSSISNCFSKKSKTEGEFSTNDLKFSLFPILNKKQKVEQVLATFETKEFEAPIFTGRNFNQVPIHEQGHWTYFQDTRMLSISSETLDLLGISREKTNINPMIGLLLLSHKSDRAILLKHLKNPQIDCPVEFRIVDNYKKIRWLKLEIQQHRAGIWQGNVNDITQCKAIEEKHRNAYLELESMLYKSAHNLKGPASSVVALTKIAINEVTDPKALEYLNMIYQSSERLEAIINDLLNVNKIKQCELEPQSICIQELANAVIENLKYLKGFDEMEIHTDFNHNTSVISDRNQLYSIFQNLIENAIKYKKPCRPGKLLISTSDTGQGVMISFSDNGTGIPEEAGDKIFGMFYRATNMQSGSGLGLYIVKTAIKKLGGDIKLSSRIGLGTTFTLFLPFEI